MNDDIGDRFKALEACWDFALPRRLPMIVRVDGRAFHSLKLDKPFDAAFWDCMMGAAKALCEEIQGARWAFFQSDEISVIARDDMQLNTQPWVGKRLSKVVSLAASIATEMYNYQAHLAGRAIQGGFDARAFVVPSMDEAINYCIWRQQDAIRNSVSMAARAVFSHKECDHKSSADLVEMLIKAGKPWEDVQARFKHGAVMEPVVAMKPSPMGGDPVPRRSWRVYLETPVFTKDRGYLERLYERGAE